MEYNFFFLLVIANFIIFHFGELLMTVKNCYVIAHAGFLLITSNFIVIYDWGFMGLLFTVSGDR